MSNSEKPDQAGENTGSTVKKMWDDDLQNELKDVCSEKWKELSERFSHDEGLLLVDDGILQEMGIDKAADRDVILRKLQKHKPSLRDRFKVINDPIHGTINLHPLAIFIMNTPQFQRLHHVKQKASTPTTVTGETTSTATTSIVSNKLSVNYMVYPGAVHSRFEHCVGVYHLAGKLVNLLKEQQPELGITAIDAMCVQLAALCHDIGHGPFSHMFDRSVIPELRKKKKEDAAKNGDQAEKGDKLESDKHEDISIKLIDFICKEQPSGELHAELVKWGLTSKDIEFIKCLVKGKEFVESNTGRNPKTKSFLSEIVANDRNGMDVDKWDYLVRDSYYLGIKCNFEPDRLIHYLKVLPVDGTLQVCVRDKERDSVFSMFQARYDLFRKAYHHPVCEGVDMMIAEAMVKAGDHLKVGGKTLLECCDDMQAFTELHDGCIFKILDIESDDQDQDVTDSKNLLRRVARRDLWKCVFQTPIPADYREKTGMEMVKKLKERFPGLNFIQVDKKMHFGQKESNPLKEICFYDKQSNPKPYKMEGEMEWSILPQEFQRKYLRIYCTSEGFKSELYPELEAFAKEEFPKMEPKA